ncbi:hypothetical protein [Flammeovirga pacifica]|uniref:Uncharacterized protein n=1 Tax=Flammeovirga pacifica TaxID=915059 RepID=A0A1S1YWE7_FLAPC|nr:hypothetical protein [Flammeovirga pacifica]OHX65135.1 hypothetical protein NH26_01580 [Flammeovirga pacifica]
MNSDKLLKVGYYTINEFQTYENVTYYTLQEVDEEGEPIGDSETDQFIGSFMDTEYRSNIQELFKSIEIIGEEYGALDRFFRHEQSAHGLPPPTSLFSTILNVSDAEIPLRLYCLRVTEEVVILFNGGNKTAEKAQDCPNVAPHFNFANRAANSIDQLILSRDIQIDGKDLECSETIEL